MLFNSINYSIPQIVQFNWNLIFIVCPYFSLSVSKIWNLADYRTFFGYFETKPHFFDNFCLQCFIFFTKFNSTFYSFVNIFTKLNSKIYSFVIFFDKIQLKNLFKMLKLAVFNSIKYSFNMKTWVSDRANATGWKQPRWGEG